ncbi:MAG: SIR2 family protein, partial [Candidatus Lokiarchaeota archaeon]|nr:SIR2 family protein [Candidatus Lokiarchaeota archaeon]
MPLNATAVPLAEALKAAFPGGLVIFAGAGTSIPPPSCSPSWWTLTEEIIESFFARVPASFNLPKDMLIKNPDRQPEQVFENFANILGDRLFQVFDALDVTEPNDVHKAVAHLAKAGVLKACFTTNFDIFFERALKEAGVPFDLLIDNAEYAEWMDRARATGGVAPPGGDRFVLCKIHGSIERPE